jgi:hypothetical protein
VAKKAADFLAINFFKGNKIQWETTHSANLEWIKADPSKLPEPELPVNFVEVRIQISPDKVLATFVFPKKFFGEIPRT